MPRQRVPIDIRWSARVDTTGGPAACHPWTGHLVGGYGHIAQDDGRDIGTHVYTWLRTNGPIPEGLHVDHVCHNTDLTCPGGPTCSHRRCCNIAHLQLASPGDNVRSGRSPMLAAIRITARNHARKGGPRQGGRRAKVKKA